MQQQQESSETLNEQETNKPPENKPDAKETAKQGRLSHLASLLNEKPLDAEDDTDTEDKDEGKPGPTDKDKNKDDEKSEKGKGGSKTAIKTFSELSKAVGIDKAALYDVKVTLRDQETHVSIGELKDAYQEAQDLDFQRIEFGERKAAEEQEMARARQELEVLVSLVPKESLKKEQIEAATKVVQTQLERAKADLIRRVPEWEDIELRKKEGAEIDAYLKDYGVRLSSIRDAAVIHALRNAWLQDKRIKTALEKIKKSENNTPSPSGKSDRRSSQSKGRNTSARGTQISRHLLGQLEE
jgi:hypothetical protein